MRSSRNRANEGGFTFVEVLAATGVLSVLVLCTVNLGDVYGRMTGDLLQRQKAVFVIDAEMERLSALYATTSFGALSLPQSTGYPALSSIANSTSRTSYSTGNALTPFVTTSASTFSTADTYVWATGAGSTTNDYVWLDRDHNAMARISWTTCPIAATTISACLGGKAGGGAGPAGAFNCYPASGSTGSGTCQFLILVLDYPYWLQGGVATASAKLSTMTLSTIVGRRR